MKNIKTYSLNFMGTVYSVAPVIHHYINNDVLAIGLVDIETGEDFGLLTVNLVDEFLPSEDCSYVDTNNLGQEICSFIEDNQLGVSVGYYGMSGYCVYPLYQFDVSKFNTEKDVIDFLNNGGEQDA